MSERRSKKYNELSLRDKIEVIRYAEHNGERATAAKFNIGKTTVNNLKKRRAELLKLFDEQKSSTLSQRMRIGIDSDINRLTYDWFLRTKAKNIRIQRSTLQIIARKYAQRLNIPFKACNGWLEFFLKRNEIKIKTLATGICSNLYADGSNSFARTNYESRGDELFVNELHSQFADITRGYRPEDIFNADECTLFYRMTPEQMLKVSNFSCANGEMPNERLTVLLVCSMTGERLKPFVIGNCATPECLKNISEKELPVIWRGERRTWMTCGLFVEWLKIVNRQMAKVQRKILLFIDDCPVHPKLYDFSHISLKFLPANPITAVQPLDMGLITMFKSYYRKFLLSYVTVYPLVSPGNKCVVNEFDAIYWIEQAWETVSLEDIFKCFTMADFSFCNEEFGEDMSITETMNNALSDFSEFPQLHAAGYDLNEYILCDEDTNFCDVAKEEREIFDDVFSDMVETLKQDDDNDKNSALPRNITDTHKIADDELDRPADSTDDDVIPVCNEPILEQSPNDVLSNEQISTVLGIIINSATINCPNILPLLSQARIEVNQLIREKRSTDDSIDTILGS